MKEIQKRKTKKTGNGRKAILTTVLILAAVYFAGVFYFHGHYLPETTVNGEEISYQTVDQAKAVASTRTDSYILTLTERGGGTETIDGDQIGLQLVFGTWFEDLMKKQNEFLWPYSFFTSDAEELEQVVSYDETKLSEVLEGLNCMDSSKWVASEDASLGEWQDGSGYELKKAVYGTTLKTDVFAEKVKEAVGSLTESLNLSDAGCYEDPVYDEESQAVQTMKQTADTYGSASITYTFGSNSEVIDREQIEEWMNIDSDLNVTLDEEAIAEFVAQMASAHNTAGQAKTLATSYGQTVTVAAATYGWKIDQTSTIDQILEKIQNGETYSGDPVYTQTANSHDGNDYGNTYVEINLTAQHLYYYKNGALVTDCDIVSGNESEGNGTPVGAYFINYLDKDATLKGEDYESEVQYWMPFNGDIGLHDADWRSSFGGDIYLTNGSHGCINLPPSSAAVIFNNISSGTPVLVYTLPGTEAVTEDSSDESEDTSSDEESSEDSSDESSTEETEDNVSGEE